MDEFAYGGGYAAQRAVRRYVLEDLIGETLDLLVELAGRPALAEVVKCFPTFSYHNPKG